MKKINDNLIKLTNLLSDNQFHDGISIGNQLNITRAAVWKAIKKLEGYGIPLQAVKGRGYSLDAPIILLDQKKIKSALRTKSITIEMLEKVDSTNNYLKQFCGQTNRTMACIAETQTNGKGRFQRNWHSPFGQNIYLSLLYPINKEIGELSGLSLIVGLAICSIIETQCHLPDPLVIKWPNDIICNHKKLAGTLIEIQAETHAGCHLIVGVGINVNLERDADKKINQRWTSIKKITQQYQDRNNLCAALIDNLILYLKRFEKNGMGDFLSEWREKDYLLNQIIRLKSNRQEFKGQGLGINEHGHLLLKLPDGEIKAFASGDTALLK